jgi:predicted TPR repeat methyltransferase
MLNRARALLGPEAMLIQSVLPELGADGEFDAAISTFDGLNYLGPDDFRRGIAAIAAHLRPGGWFIFDLHTDGLMQFTLTNPRIAGEEQGFRFEIVTTVDPQDRSCVTTIDMTTLADGDTFTERHVQYFHTDSQVRAALADAGFGAVTVMQEYTDAPATPETLRATWVARLDQ